MGQSICDEHGELDVKRDAVRDRLIVAARGSLSDWRDACLLALDSGWTHSEVNKIMFWYHPSTWVYAFLAVVGLIPIGIALWENWR